MTAPQNPTPEERANAAGETPGNIQKAQGAVTSKVAASIQNWKRKLLDLTNRNRALNFKPTKVSTVAIVDEQPAAVFRILYLEERPMKFKATSEEESPTDAAAARFSLQPGNLEPIPLVDFEDDEFSAGIDFAPYDPSSLGEKHKDDWLQTASKPEALDKSLLRLDIQARASIEEQGVNTLFLALAMLHYKESPNSDTTLKAPIVLLPVELFRNSVRSGYGARITDDEPLVNPALSELLRQQHGITLPALPDLQNVTPEYDLQELLSRTQESIAGKKGWSIKTDIYLGLFSFQKLVMYKDLEANTVPLTNHRLIRQLITRTGMPIAGLPKEIRDMNLDVVYPPEAGGQVVDADSSQLRAIVAAGRGLDLVIEGPPGTGKSQTITNLIAQALAADQTVLFVAEKMAALSVVHSRLVEAGLGEFCLELHSTKTNKRVVMQQLGATLNKSLSTIVAPTAARQRLPAVRGELSRYVSAVHEPFGMLGLSPFRGYGELEKVREARSVQYSGPVDSVSREQLERTLRALGDLTATSAEIGTPDQHPWRDATKRFYSPGDIQAIALDAEEVQSALKNVMANAKIVFTEFSISPVNTFAAVASVTSFGEIVHRSPGVAAEILQSESWNKPPDAATSLIARGVALRKLRERAFRVIDPSVAGEDHASDIQYVEKKLHSVFAV